MSVEKRPERLYFPVLAFAVLTVFVAAIAWQVSWTRQSRHIFDRYSHRQAQRAQEALQELIDHPLFEQRKAQGESLLDSWFRRELERAERGLHLDALALISEEGAFIPASENSRLFFEEYGLQPPLSTKKLPEGFELLPLEGGYEVLVVFTLEFPRLLKLQQEATLAGLIALASLSLLVIASLVFTLNSLEKRREGLELDARLQQFGRMAAEVVHAIRNPLASLNLQAGELREIHQGDEETQEILQAMQQGIVKINHTLGLMTVLNRENRPMNQKIRPMELLHQLRKNFESSHFLMKIEVEADEVLLGNEELFGNMLENLIANSKDAGARTIRLRLFREGQRFHLLVEDDGPGLPASKDVFQPFFTTKAQGLGLGLMVVKEAVELHRGRVTSSSSSDLGGACFEILLPV